MGSVQKKTTKNVISHSANLWTMTSTNYDIMQVLAINKNFIEIVARCCHESLGDACAFFDISPKLAEKLGEYWRADQQYLKNLKLANSTLEERPLASLYERINFSTGLLFKIRDENALLENIKRKRDIPVEVDSTAKAHVRTIYLNYIKRTLNLPVYFVKYFTRVITGLQSATLVALNRYDDVVVNQAAFFPWNFSLRLADDDLLTLLTTSDTVTLESTRIRVVLKMLAEMNHFQNSHSPKSEFVFNHIFDDSTTDVTRREMLSPETIVHVKEMVNETIESEYWLESYAQPWLATYMLLISNNVPHAVSKNFFIDRFEKANGKMATMAKHMTTAGYKVRFTENWDILNLYDYTLATYFCAIYLPAVKASRELKPLVTLSCYHFFQLQICKDLPESFQKKLSEELSAAKATKLIQSYSENKMDIKYQVCPCCNLPFWHIQNNKRFCPACHLSELHR